jgi:hypothetical protein
LQFKNALLQASLRETSSVNTSAVPADTTDFMLYSAPVTCCFPGCRPLSTVPEDDDSTLQLSLDDTVKLTSSDADAGAVYSC